MRRTDWLADAHVAGFTRYLKDIVFGVPGSFVQRHRRFDVSCFGEAVASYSWAGLDLLETTALLGDVGATLREAVARRDHGEVLARCVEIIAWGGVSNDATAKCLVRRYDTGALPLDIELGAATLLSENDADSDAFRDNVSLRSDSAMTKVHAAQDARSVVYDERVGAALGRLALEYLTRVGAPAVPAPLAFMIGAERRRDPSVGAWRFTRKRTGAAHALWNQRANWLVADVVADPRRDARDVLPATVGPQRAVEAGLFMIGYDVTSVVSVEVPLRAPPRPEARTEGGAAPRY